MSDGPELRARHVIGQSAWAGAGSRLRARRRQWRRRRRRRQQQHQRRRRWRQQRRRRRRSDAETRRLRAQQRGCDCTKNESCPADLERRLLSGLAERRRRRRHRYTSPGGPVHLPWLSGSSAALWEPGTVVMRSIKGWSQIGETVPSATAGDAPGKGQSEKSLVN